ncbi:MAG: chemotaxis protein CheW [Myxococcota bacterium]
MEPSQDLVVVQISGKAFGLATSVVSEVLPMVEPTPMPGWSANALGFINVRGEIIPLVDIAPVIGLPSSPVSRSQFIVLLSALRRKWGVIVDQVEGVRNAQVLQNKGLAPLEVVDASDLCLGLAVEPTGPVVVLDPEGIIRRIKLPWGEAESSRSVSE